MSHYIGPERNKVVVLFLLKWRADSSPQMLLVYMRMAATLTDRDGVSCEPFPRRVLITQFVNRLECHVPGIVALLS